MEHEPKYSSGRKRLDSFLITNRSVLISTLGCITIALLLVLGYHLIQSDPLIPRAPQYQPALPAVAVPKVSNEKIERLERMLQRAEALQTRLDASIKAQARALPPTLPDTQRLAPAPAVPLQRVAPKTTFMPTATPTAAPTVPPPPQVQPLQDLADVGIVVMCYNRPDYLARTMASLKSRLPSSGVTVYISQDGKHPGVAAEAAKHPTATHLVHERPAQSAFGRLQGSPVYYYISLHYKFAFTQLFDVHKHKYAIFIEDDMEFAVDFFQFFMATLPLMETDKTIWAVSSWNDNGQAEFVSDPRKIYRSDYFPGLGWGTSRAIWNELKPKWPAGFWDDWLRLPAQRKSRVTLRPEISRSGNFGVKGSSGGEFFSEHIGSIKVNTVAVDFTSLPLSGLRKAAYDAAFTKEVNAARVVAGLEQVPVGGAQSFKVLYNSLPEYEKYASSHHLMEDSKAGVARCAYLGVVSIKWRGNKVFFVPRSFGK